MDLSTITHYLMDLWYFSYSDTFLSDVARKLSGYLPIIWSLVDDFYGPTVAIKTLKTTVARQKFNSDTLSRMFSNPFRYLIILDFIISLGSQHEFAPLHLLIILLTCSIAYFGWQYIGKQEWLFLDAKRTITSKHIFSEYGPVELRLYILNFCIIFAVTCLYSKFEYMLLSFIFLLFYFKIILYNYKLEKYLTILLAVLTMTWPLLILAMVEDNPVTSSIRPKAQKKVSKKVNHKNN